MDNKMKIFFDYFLPVFFLGSGIGGIVALFINIIWGIS